MYRQAAINHQKSIIVKAPAGSGKTEMLVQRYLALLARDCSDPGQIIAITFTRKAAAEMLSRIRNELSQAQDANYSPTYQHKQDTHKLAKEVLAKATKNNWHKASLVTEENVTTIDAFCHTLVSISPLKAGFFTMPEVMTDSSIQELYMEASEEAMQTMKQELLADSKKKKDREALKQLLYLHNNSQAKLRESIATILANRTQILPLIQDKDYDPQKHLKHLCSLLSDRLAATAPPDQWMELITKALDANRHNFEEVGMDISELDPTQNWQEADLANWQCLANILLTKSGTLRKAGGFTKTYGFISGSKQKENIVDAVELIREPDCDEWLALLQASRNWQDKYTAEELQVATMAQRIIYVAAIHLNQIFKRENKCDHTEIMLAAIQVMGQEQAPTLLAERLGSTLRHLLVDEFQDTSAGQLNLLGAITTSWDETTNNSLFLVGDPMQSIYAFRQADVRIFNQLWQESRIGQVPLDQLTLKENYRSNKPIVKWLNDNFVNIFPPRPNNLINSVVYTPAEAVNDPPKAPKPEYLGVMYPKDITPTDEQIFSPVIEKVKEIIEQKPDKTIGILARKRNDAKGIVALLHKENIGVDVGKFSYMADNHLIVDLMSLTRALYDTEDEIAWYACLRAPWCGLQLQDILEVSKLKKDASTSQVSLWEVLQSVADGALDKHDISEDGKQRIKHFVAKISLAMAIRRRTNWHNTIERAWASLGERGLNNLSPDDLSDMEVFMEHLQQLSTGDKINLKELHNRMQIYGATFVSQSPVKIMTIHHSKGLEFDYVFIVNMDKRGRSNTGSGGLLDVADFVLGNTGETGAVISANAPGYPEANRPVYTMLKDIKHTQQDQELRRLFYVACSRARSGLFFHYACKYKDGEELELKPSANSFLKLLEETSLNEALDNIQHISEKGRGSGNADKSTIKRIKQTELAELVKLAKDDFKTSPFPEWHGPYDRVQGTAIHRVMEELAAMSEEELQELATGKNKQLLRQEFLDGISLEIKQLVRQQGLDDKDANQVLAALKDTTDFCLQDERGMWILKQQGMNEWAFMRQNAAGIIIDRTFVDAGTRWIVDYKTVRMAAAVGENPFTEEQIVKFHSQLKNYGEAMDILQKAKEGEGEEQLPIKLGVYCPQNGFWQEWDYLDE